MIMNANRPAFGEQLGRTLALAGDAQGMSVMSNVRSSPGGLALAWDRSMYLQVAGEQKPHPPRASAKPWAPPAPWGVDPISFTLGTGGLLVSRWQAKTAAAPS